MDRPMMAPAQQTPPVPQMVDQAMGRFNPQSAAITQSPDAAAAKAAADAMTAGADPLAAAKEAWKQAARMAADPNTPDEPGSGNLRKLQQHLIQTKQMDPLTAWAIAHEALPRLAQSGGAPGG